MCYTECGDVMKMDTINFEKQKGKPLYRQIYEKLKDDILNGYLVKGDSLPSIRKCVAMMKVSKTSVERAYELLLEEGFLVAVPQKGYFVDVESENVRFRKQLLETREREEQLHIRYDFRSQSMDVSSFDLTLWKKYLKEVLAGHEEIATYGDPQGERSLRLALQKYAYTMRGVLCTPEQILIGSSFQSLLYILCGLIRKQAVIGMEESGFRQAETVFADYGFVVKKLPSDEEGIDVASLYEQHVDIVYINSASQGRNHQPINKQKRKALVTWAKASQGYIIEDDHNGELRYQSKLTPAMQGFDDGGHVIYIGSFSKILLPSLRISYMVLPDMLKECYQLRKSAYAPTSSKIEQLALAQYIADGHLVRHVRRLRRHYEQKSTIMRSLLEASFPQADILLEEAALQFVLRFPAPVKVDTLIQAALQQGIILTQNTGKELVLSFAAIKLEDMETAIAMLRQCWKTCL